MNLRRAVSEGLQEWRLLALVEPRFNLDKSFLGDDAFVGDRELSSKLVFVSF